METGSNRDRLLQLIDIMFSETDEDHLLSLQQLKERLELRIPGCSVSLNTIANDLDYLRERINGSEKTKFCSYSFFEQDGHHGAKSYAIARDEFDAHEIRVLIDAVASARFLTKQDTSKLIGKICALTSRHIAAKMASQVQSEGFIKTKNPYVRYYLGTIHQSITERTMITFQYKKYALHNGLKPEFIHNGQVYLVAPYSVLWNGDNYYLVGLQDGYEKEKTFRVDRMHGVEQTNRNYRDPLFDSAKFLQRVFNMFPGQVETVRIQFATGLLNVVTDRFGTEIPIFKINDSLFEVIIQAAVSEGLVRWLLTWGGDAKVISPQSLVNKMREETEKAWSQYK